MFSILGWVHGLQFVVQTILRMNFSPVTVVANIVGDLGLRALIVYPQCLLYSSPRAINSARNSRRRASFSFRNIY